MTRHAKEKLKRKNAEKDAKRRRMTVEEMEQKLSLQRKAVAESYADMKNISDNLDEIYRTWQEWFCRYVVPRLCAGFYYSAIVPAKKRLIRPAAEQFLEELSAGMQSVVDKVCNNGDVDLDLFDYYKEKIEAEGYELPLWAEKSDLDDDMNALFEKLGLPKPQERRK